jgi:hypothetical protein
MRHENCRQDVLLSTPSVLSMRRYHDTNILEGQFQQNVESSKLVAALLWDPVLGNTIYNFRDMLQLSFVSYSDRST